MLKSRAEIYPVHSMRSVQICDPYGAPTQNIKAYFFYLFRHMIELIRSLFWSSARQRLSLVKISPLYNGN